MDGRRFDTISRLLAGAGTRRGALKAALGLMAGGSALAAGEVAARPALCRPAGRYCTHNKQCCGNRCRTGKRVPIASRNICDCDAPFGMCGKMCRDLSSDPNHCGACGNQIDRETELCCDGVPTAIDEENCHACGNVCGPDDVCCGPEIGCAASCEPDGGSDGTCPADQSCTATINDVGGRCWVDLEDNVYQGCYIQTSSQPSVASCTSNADCATSYAECGQNGVECYCSCAGHSGNPGAINGGVIDFLGPSCVPLQNVGGSNCE